MSESARMLKSLGLQMKSFTIYDAGVRVGYRTLCLPDRKYKSAIFYLPGRWQNASMWAHDIPDRDIRLFLARQGYLVCSMDYRTHFVKEVDKEMCAGWRTTHFLEDITLCMRHFIERSSVNELFIAGYSMGAALSFMLPHYNLACSVKGFICLDGGVKNFVRTQRRMVHDELIRIQGHEQSGIMLNPATTKRFREYAIQCLNGEGEAFPKEYRGSLSMSMDNDTLRYLLIEDAWWPTLQVAEMNSISDHDCHPQLVSDRNLKHIKYPIYCVAAVKNMKEIENHRAVVSARLTSSSSVDILPLQGWTHTDVMTSIRTPSEIGVPVIKWLERNR